MSYKPRGQPFLPPHTAQPDQGFPVPGLAPVNWNHQVTGLSPSLNLKAEAVSRASQKPPQGLAQGQAVQAVMSK